MMEAHTQFPQKVNVWAGTTNRQIIDTYFFEGTINGDVYLDLLTNFLVPTLKLLFPNINYPNEVDSCI